MVTGCVATSFPHCLQALESAAAGQELTARIAALEAQERSLAQELAHARSVREELATEAGAKDSALQHAELAAASLSEAHTQSEAQLVQRTAELQRALEDIAALQAERASVLGALRDLQRNAVELQQRASDSDAAQQLAHSAIAELEASLIMLQATHAQLLEHSATDIAALAQAAAVAEAQLAASADECAALSQERDAAHTAHQALAAGVRCPTLCRRCPARMQHKLTSPSRRWRRMSSAQPRHRRSTLSCCSAARTSRPPTASRSSGSLRPCAARWTRRLC